MIIDGLRTRFNVLVPRAFRWWLLIIIVQETIRISIVVQFVPSGHRRCRRSAGRCGTGRGSGRRPGGRSRGSLTSCWWFACVAIRDEDRVECIVVGVVR